MPAALRPACPAAARRSTTPRPAWQSEPGPGHRTRRPSRAPRSDTSRIIAGVVRPTARRRTSRIYSRRRHDYSDRRERRRASGAPDTLASPSYTVVVTPSGSRTALVAAATPRVAGTMQRRSLQREKRPPIIRSADGPPVRPVVVRRLLRPMHGRACSTAPPAVFVEMIEGYGTARVVRQKSNTPIHATCIPGDYVTSLATMDRLASRIPTRSTSSPSGAEQCALQHLILASSCSSRCSSAALPIKLRPVLGLFEATTRSSRSYSQQS